MSLTPEDWHQRYLEQARWTDNIRKYLFDKSNLSGVRHVLDVGIGTGALEYDFTSNFYPLPFGLDIDHKSLTLAKKNISSLALIQGNARQLPYASGVFEICFCHFVLLWVEFPDQVVAEMARVTRSGGSVIAIAEPDYGGRIDYPEALDQIGNWQARSLQRQGADPHLGRKLIQLFDQAGLTEIEVGVVGGRWTISPAQEGFESEWRVIEADLETLRLSPAERRLARQLQQKDAVARSKGIRVLFVPTFYAWGKIPETA